MDSTELSVTYYLNRLQQLPVASPVMVTVNPPHETDLSLVLAEFDFEHPLFDREAMEMQKRVPEIQGLDRIWYAGAWQRYGFHEDGLWSAVRVAESMGIAAPWAAELEAMNERAAEAAGAPALAPEAD